MIDDETNIIKKDNLLDKLCDNDNIYYYNYLNIIQNFLIFGTKTLLIKNDEYFKYIIIKGIEVIGHVYIFLLMYSKNTSLTNYHSQKAYFYFLEFMGQIHNESNTFLNLNIKDAKLFVYRKTIFLIDDIIRDNHRLNDKDRKTLYTLNRKILCSENYIKIIIMKYFHYLHICENTNTINNCYEIILNIINYNEDKFEEQDINSPFNNIIVEVINICHMNNISISECHKIIIRLIKKIEKLSTNNSIYNYNSNSNNMNMNISPYGELYKIIKLNLSQDYIGDKIKNLSYIKFVNYICN